MKVLCTCLSGILVRWSPSYCIITTLQILKYDAILVGFQSLLVGERVLPFARRQVFPEDIFETLGESRSDFRWLVIGPARTGDVITLAVVSLVFFYLRGCCCCCFL